MGFYDIYGNNLRRGFCEVHPHIEQEYPCQLCILEQNRYDQQRHDYEREYYDSLFAAECADWFDPNAEINKP